MQNFSLQYYVLDYIEIEQDLQAQPPISIEEALKKAKEPSPYDVPTVILPPLSEVRAGVMLVCGYCCQSLSSDIIAPTAICIAFLLCHPCCTAECKCGCPSDRQFVFVQEDERIAELEYLKVEAHYRAEWGLGPGETL